MARWAVNPLARFHWRGWGSESVVFEAVSGEMAVLDALEAAVMACFEYGPRDLQTLTEELAADLSMAADNDLKARLRAIIEDFVVRGWLQPAEPV
jgi:PqqD family protein of HPr-rel-A system